MHKSFLIPYCHSVEEHADLWADVLEFFSACSCNQGLWLLEGPLGSGKTLFVQQWAKKHGYQQVLTSPTYSLMEFYSDLKMAHYDLYRIETARELGVLNLPDMMDYLNFVEWGERFSELKMLASGIIRIHVKSNFEREIFIEIL